MNATERSSMFYAEIETRGWPSESEPGSRWLGPFEAEGFESEEEVRSTLEARGDTVLRVVTAEEYEANFREEQSRTWDRLREARRDG
jgi:hypothetical protein